MSQNNTAKTVLIVEDEATHINLFERNIRRIRDIAVDVLTANNGEEAMEHVNAHFAEPDAARLLMLLDLNMPIMDGFAVMEHLNSQAYRQQVEVVVLSTSDENEDTARAQDLGCDRYLVKPISAGDLRTLIEGM